MSLSIKWREQLNRTNQIDLSLLNKNESLIMTNFILQNEQQHQCDQKKIAKCL